MRDWLDGFERRVDSRLFEEQNWDNLEKLTADEKRVLQRSLHQKISQLQNSMNDLRKKQTLGKSLDELRLSQMILMWIYDQVKYGRR